MTAQNVVQQLEALMGPSPEEEHIYGCPSCGNDERFIGVDDYGLPGKEDECDRCGKPVIGDDGGRCWCPAFVELTQEFIVEVPGQEPTYLPFTGGASGAHIEAYTRIYCGGCGELTWVNERGLGPVVAGRIERDGELAPEEGRALLARAVHGDLRGVLDAVELPHRTESRVRQVAEALETDVWQAALDERIERSFYGPVRLWNCSTFLRERTELDGERLQAAFERALSTNPVEVFVSLEQVDVPVELTVTPEAVAEGLASSLGWDADRVMDLVEASEPVREAMSRPEHVQTVVDAVLPKHPDRALAFRDACPAGDRVTIDEGRLREAVEGWTSQEKMVDLLEAHEDACRILLDEGRLAWLLRAEDQGVRHRAALLARHLSDPEARKNALGRREGTGERGEPPRGRGMGTC